MLVLLLVVGLAIYGTLARSREILEAWARGEGYRLLGAERAWLWRGPFWLRSSNSQHVFRIRVEDEDGAVREGYARVGGWFFGIFTDAVAVRWDDAV